MQNARKNWQQCWSRPELFAVWQHLQVFCNFSNDSKIIQKKRKLIEAREYDAYIAKYIPGTLELVFQWMIEDIDTKKQPTHFLQEHETFWISNFTNKQLLYKPKQHSYMLPRKIKKKPNSNNDIDTDLITVSNFFPHLVKEISITKYDNDKQLISTFLTTRSISIQMQCVNIYLRNHF